MLRCVLMGLVPLLSACARPQTCIKGPTMPTAAAALPSKEASPPLDLAGNDAGRFRTEHKARLDQAERTFAGLEAYAAACAQGPSGAASAPDAAALLEGLDALTQQIDRAVSHAGLMRSVHPDEAMRKVAEEAEQDFSRLTTALGLSRPLYAALAAARPDGLDAPGRRYLTHTLRDFQRSGVAGDDATQQTVRRLKGELVDIGQQFDKHIRNDVRHVALAPNALDGLPEDYRAQHPPGADGKVHISTDYPDYVPFMTYSRDDAARRALYVAFRQRGYPANEPVLLQLLEKRQELAKALGYASWADYITADKMIGSANAAQAFIDKVAELVVVRARRDKQEMLHVLQQTDPGAREVADWQKAFLEEEARKSRYALDSQKLRTYFAFAKVRDGILATTAKMFGVRYERLDVQSWHADVEAYALYEGEKLLGHFYLDLHPRAGKYKHAAAFPIQAGFVSGGVRQLPAAALVCNFAAGDDALMEHDDVTTFFHEFGHLLHHLFASQGRYVGQAGIATEWDFVEAPSQMLEEWSYDGQVLRSFAQDAQGHTIDDAQLAALRRARNLGRGLWVQQQMFYAALSLGYHHQPKASPVLKNTDALVRELQARYAPFSYVDGTHFQLSFGHLEGYSAMYYTYMWSLVIAKDLFGAFAATGDLLAPQVASRYRAAVLAPGGSKDAAELISDFLLRPFQIDAFAEWVNADE